jgi:predicted acyltransferase
MSSLRLASLDQFRGYTVLAMFAVNFVGGLANVPNGLKHHHTYCSFADTIMPQFLFAVGFGMRLSFLRRRETDGAKKAYLHFLGRCLGLILLGVLLYHLTGKYEKFADLTVKPFGEFLLGTIKRHPFETLTHIGVTSLWVLPVVAAAGWVRVLFAAASGGLHVWFSHLGYYEWNMSGEKGIDGGPLGFLTWAIPLVLGTLTHDWVMRERPNGTGELFAIGLLVAVLGYGLSLLNKYTLPNDIRQYGDLKSIHDGFPFGGPPTVFAVNYWTMSQRAGSVTYPLFAAGFALMVYAACRVLCDRWGFRWGYLDLFGRHALAGYIVHDMADGAVKAFVPKDSPWWWVAIGFAVFLGLITVVLRYLDRNRLFLKL